MKNPETKANSDVDATTITQIRQVIPFPSLYLGRDSTMNEGPVRISQGPQTQKQHVTHAVIDCLWACGLFLCDHRASKVHLVKVSLLKDNKSEQTHDKVPEKACTCIWSKSVEVVRLAGAVLDALARLIDLSMGTCQLKGQATSSECLHLLLKLFGAPFISKLRQAMKQGTSGHDWKKHPGLAHLVFWTAASIPASSELFRSHISELLACILPLVCDSDVHNKILGLSALRKLFVGYPQGFDLTEKQALSYFSPLLVPVLKDNFAFREAPVMSALLPCLFGASHALFGPPFCAKSGKSQGDDALFDMPDVSDHSVRATSQPSPTLQILPISVNNDRSEVSKRSVRRPGLAGKYTLTTSLIEQSEKKGDRHQPSFSIEHFRNELNKRDEGRAELWQSAIEELDYLAMSALPGSGDSSQTDKTGFDDSNMLHVFTTHLAAIFDSLGFQCIRFLQTLLQSLSALSILENADLLYSVLHGWSALFVNSWPRVPAHLSIIFEALLQLGVTNMSLYLPPKHEWKRQRVKKELILVLALLRHLCSGHNSSQSGSPPFDSLVEKILARKDLIILHEIAEALASDKYRKVCVDVDYKIHISE